MFKNFKWSECDNFLYGAFVALGLAGVAALYLALSRIDFSSEFVRNIGFLVNIGLVLTAMITGTAWLDESLKAVHKLIRNKKAESHPRYMKLWQDLSAAYDRIGTIAAICFIFLCGFGATGCIFWLIGD